MKAKTPPPVAARGAPVTEAIFQATFEEIARVGYGGLTRELVAVRAGVNKSTVYRRWPTTLALVEAAFSSTLTRIVPRVPNTSTLRGDLLALVLDVARIAGTAQGRASMRVFLFDELAPELASVATMLHEEQEMRGPKLIIDRAIGRGELPPGTDRAFVVDTVNGAVLYKLLVGHVPGAGLDEAHARKLVDVLLYGLLGSKKPAKSPRARRKA